MQALATKALHKVFESLSRRDEDLRELCQQALGTLFSSGLSINRSPQYTIADELASVSPDEAG